MTIDDAVFAVVIDRLVRLRRSLGESFTAETERKARAIAGRVGIAPDQSAKLGLREDYTLDQDALRVAKSRIWATGSGHLVRQLHAAIGDLSVAEIEAFKDTQP